MPLVMKIPQVFFQFNFRKKTLREISWKNIDFGVYLRTRCRSRTPWETERLWRRGSYENKAGRVRRRTFGITQLSDRWLRWRSTSIHLFDRYEQSVRYIIGRETRKGARKVPSEWHQTACYCQTAHQSRSYVTAQQIRHFYDWRVSWCNQSRGSFCLLIRRQRSSFVSSQRVIANHQTLSWTRHSKRTVGLHDHERRFLGESEACLWRVADSMSSDSWGNDGNLEQRHIRNDKR